MLTHIYQLMTCMFNSNKLQLTTLMGTFQSYIHVYTHRTRLQRGSDRVSIQRLSPTTISQCYYSACCIFIPPLIPQVLSTSTPSRWANSVRIGYFSKALCVKAHYTALAVNQLFNCHTKLYTHNCPLYYQNHHQSPTTTEDQNKESREYNTSSWYTPHVQAIKIDSSNSTIAHYTHSHPNSL